MPLRVADSVREAICLASRGRVDPDLKPEATDGDRVSRALAPQWRPGVGARTVVPLQLVLVIRNTHVRCFYVILEPAGLSVPALLGLEGGPCRRAR